ncbi:hypothetical protein LCGC14_1107750 [marine sediment metagenome]|uniref:Uncharacterized protein n=1 Tax=marine sediment metagenome TaxID=412755 RepID=A0A0F9MCC2_9ZZZZ
MIEEGMVITNWDGYLYDTVELERGHYGILMTSEYRGERMKAFLPYELPPTTDGDHWRKWMGWARGNCFLPNGVKLGVVSFFRGHPGLRTLEGYDLEWERTETLMREEEILKWFFGS